MPMLLRPSTLARPLLVDDIFIPIIPTCMQGDAVMVAATETSSSRIHWDGDLPWLLGTVVGTWVLASVMIGDYR